MKTNRKYDHGLLLGEYNIIKDSTVVKDHLSRLHGSNWHQTYTHIIQAVNLVPCSDFGHMVLTIN